MDVSVVFINYNYDIDRILSTINSVIIQEGVDFELIISDDFSIHNHFDEIKSFLKKKKFSNYKFTSTEKNLGIVGNYLNGVSLATGKYVKGISPGDYLYDKFVLRDFFSFAEKYRAKLCVGNMIEYENKFCDYIIYETISNHKYLKYLDSTNRIGIKYKNLFYTNAFWGCMMFRERETMKDIYNILLDKVTYWDDYSYLICCIYNGIIPKYFDRNIVFHERNSGISASMSSDSYSDVFKKDEINLFHKLHEFEPKNFFIISKQYIISKNNNKSFIHYLPSLLLYYFLKFCNKIQYRIFSIYNFEKKCNQLEEFENMKKMISYNYTLNISGVKEIYFKENLKSDMDEAVHNECLYTPDSQYVELLSEIEIKNIYFIDGLNNLSVRGKHAHKKATQILFCTKGCCNVTIDNGMTKRIYYLKAGKNGICINPEIWVELNNFTDDAIVVGLSSEKYDESEYIREYEDYLNYVNREK